MRRTALALAVLLLAGADADARAQAGASPCPPRGDATRSKIQALNEKKARLDQPSDEDIDDTVTIDALLEPGDDRLRWQDGQGVAIDAYVLEVRDGGMASSNCHSSDPADQDTVLVLSPGEDVSDKAHRLIAVITPRWRRIAAESRLDWSTLAIRAKYLKKYVTVTGWLLFDFEAASRAVNTASLGGADITRATAWEIHPATAIDLNDDSLEQETRWRPPRRQPAPREAASAAYARSKTRSSAP
jgi:hypothetical protein